MFFIKFYYFLNKPINNVKLTTCDKMVYGIIDFAQKQGNGKWSLKTYANKINISQKQVQNSLTKLKKAKLITNKKGYFKVTVKTGENQFITLNSNVLNDNHLSTNTKIVYSFIRQKANRNITRYTRISIKDIYESCGCSQKCAYNCIHKLVNEGYIVTHSNKNKNTFYKIVKDLWNSPQKDPQDKSWNDVVNSTTPDIKITLISNAF